MLFRRARLDELLTKLTEFKLEPPRDFDVKAAVPLYELRRWAALGPSSAHPGMAALQNLVQQGSDFETTVQLAKIGAVVHSKGGSGMYLDRLPETMDLMPGESYGPLSESELGRLKGSVYERFGLWNGRFHLNLQEWDQLYIAENSGASRRFALWRRLTRNGSVDLPATVTPYQLGEVALRSLREDYRAIGIQENMQLWQLLYEAGEAGKHFAYLSSGFEMPSSRAIFLLPYPHMLPKAHLSPLLSLHRRVEPLFDLGRYLTERISSRAGEPV